MAARGAQGSMAYHFRRCEAWEEEGEEEKLVEVEEGVESYRRQAISMAVGLGEERGQLKIRGIGSVWLKLGAWVDL